MQCRKLLSRYQLFHILEKIAAERGLCLEEETRLEIELPGGEFEENMVTGGFEKYKGLAIEHRDFLPYP